MENSEPEAEQVKSIQDTKLEDSSLYHSNNALYSCAYSIDSSHCRPEAPQTTDNSV